MSDSNRNWKGRYFFVKGTNWVYHEEEWETMPHGFDNTWAYVKDSGWSRLLLSVYLFWISNVVYFSFFSTSVCPRITSEKEDFIHQVTEIPLDERKCRDLIILDTLHAYCEGPKPTPEACHLNAYSRCHKFICFSHFFIFPSACLRSSLIPIFMICICRNGGS